MTAPMTVHTPAPMIAIDQLHFAWPGNPHDSLVIEGLRLAAGRSLFLHGPSGCGKSTLLGLLAGVLLPRAGSVRVLDASWAELGAARRDAFRADHVGYLFQQFNLLPYLTLIDNVLLPCRFSARRRRRAEARDPSATAAARRLLQQMGLPEGAWQRPAGHLSVGQQQRVAAARALIGAPELVIADEPTSALDAALRDQFMALLMSECAHAGSSLVFVSHDDRLAAHFDDHLSLPQLNRAAARELTP